MKIKKLLKTNQEPPQLLIYNYPYGIRNLLSILKVLSIPVAIYEHNVEWKFFEEKIESNFFSRFLLFIAKKIELNNLKKADYVFCANENDKKLLIKEGVKSKNIIVWVPLSTKKHVREANPPAIIRRLRNKFIVGFLGSNFEPNIVAVENIIKIAKGLPKSIVFLVIGSVYDSFKNRDDIPSNVIFTGYVKNLNSYLAFCDAFINPKTTSDTGIETKMFDYLEYEKPIISTRIGAHGFENYKNVFIANTIEEIKEKIKELAG
jgi:glycosyltransferase involved in cell wall biosynthesis